MTLGVQDISRVRAYTDHVTTGKTILTGLFFLPWVQILAGPKPEPGVGYLTTADRARGGAHCNTLIVTPGWCQLLGHIVLGV